jgi:hypothetical protein
MRRPLLTAILLGVLGLSCDSASSGGADQSAIPDVVADPASPADPGVTPDAGTDQGVDTVTGATKLILDDTHPGWQQPACWGCHTADDHNDGKDPYMCIGCHGKDGAPAGHGGASPCAGCHTTPPHGSEGFPDPLSCKSCHGG